MIDKVLAYIEKWQMIAKQDKIVIGISGGADSVCLLLVLLELRKALEFSIVAVHVNHKLRGMAAEADEKYVEKLCAHNDVLLERYHYDVNLIAKDKKVSTEEAGRIVRREAFNKAKEKYQGTKIAMAHHKNDNVETLLMNLARGTSLKGLGGILPVRGDIIRPLLCVERKEIELFLKNKGIDYCTDESNEQDDYTRNRVRNHILPYFENEINVQTVTHMNNTIEQMQELQRYMEDQLNDWMLICVKIQKDNIIIDKKAFVKVPKVLKGMMVLKCMEHITGREKDITQTHIEQILELFEKQVGKQLLLPYKLQVRRVYEGVVFAIEKGKKEVLDQVVVMKVPGITTLGDAATSIKSRIFEKHDEESIPQKTHTKWFDYDIIKNNLEIRTRRTGDYILIDNQGNKQKLKAYFINKKVPAYERDEILLIAEGAHVLWIIGYRMSNYYQVTEHTKKILEIEIDGGNVNERKN